MQVNRCVSCMRELERYPCPHCGFDINLAQPPTYALPWNTILHGKYLMGKVIGQGGFGITYVGLDLVLELKVAIKEFYPVGQVMRHRSMGSKLVWGGEGQAEATRQARMDVFLKEARKMARVDRVPQVVRVRETFYENNTAYIVMDFVEGETLKTRLDREGPLSFPEAMGIFRPAIQAMAQVHAQGLIHRDISPDNLMLEPGGSVRILDLGAAKDLMVNSGPSSMLVTKSGFSPMEQYGQRGGSGPWTDVYAMAATIYYTLSGKVPPVAVDRMDRDDIHWDLPGLASLPAGALNALQKALTIRSTERTQSMEELLKGLESGQFPPPPERNSQCAPGPPRVEPKEKTEDTLKQRPNAARQSDTRPQSSGAVLLQTQLDTGKQRSEDDTAGFSRDQRDWTPPAHVRTAGPAAPPMPGPAPGQPGPSKATLLSERAAPTAKKGSIPGSLGYVALQGILLLGALVVASADMNSTLAVSLYTVLLAPQAALAVLYQFRRPDWLSILFGVLPVIFGVAGTILFCPRLFPYAFLPAPFPLFGAVAKLLARGTTLAGWLCAALGALGGVGVYSVILCVLCSPILLVLCVPITILTVGIVALFVRLRPQWFPVIQAKKAKTWV